MTCFSGRDYSLTPVRVCSVDNQRMEKQKEECHVSVVSPNVTPGLMIE